MSNAAQASTTESRLRYLPESRSDGYSSRYQVIFDCGNGQYRVEETTSNDNSMTFYRSYGHEIIFALNREEMGGRPDADALDAILESDEAKALAARLISGYERVWNGSNFVARFTDEAMGGEQAYFSDHFGVASEIENLIETCATLPEEAGCWEAEDWLSGVKEDVYNITRLTNDAELELLSEEIVSEALGEMVKLSSSDVLSWLEKERDALREEAEDDDDDDDAAA